LKEGQKKERDEQDFNFKMKATTTTTTNKTNLFKFTRQEKEIVYSQS